MRLKALCLLFAVPLLAQDPAQLFLDQAKDLVAQQKYEAAIEVYSKAIAAAPKDPRAYLERGHRYLNTRQFSKGIADLTVADQLARNVSEIAYHLGLAYHLSGDYKTALAIFDACLNTTAAPTGKDTLRTCGPDPEKYPGGRMDMIAWAYRSALHLQNKSRAKVLLDGVPVGLKLDAGGESYYRTMLYSKGKLSAEQVLEGLKGPSFVGAGYGVADHLLLEGKKAEACPLLERVVSLKEGYYGWGAIAGEMALKRYCATP